MEDDWTYRMTVVRKGRIYLRRIYVIYCPTRGEMSGSFKRPACFYMLSTEKNGADQWLAHPVCSLGRQNHIAHCFSRIVPTR
jgi:hypothetical protein